MGCKISNCMVDQATTVRVRRSDGEMLEFDHAVIAKQLMKAYPGHLVMHCLLVSESGIQPGSEVSMLRADDMLQLGQTYDLLRVPVHRDKGLEGQVETNVSNEDGV